MQYSLFCVRSMLDSARLQTEKSPDTECVRRCAYSESALTIWNSLPRSS